MLRSMVRALCVRGALVVLLAWTVSAQAANLQFLPGDTAVGPAIGTQTAPAIAEGNGMFLAVWQDLRTSPFIGPPFFTEGRGFDIYMQRLDANGVPLDPAPTLIAQRYGDQTEPQVAWNGENWLVVWGGPNSTLFNHRIQAVRVAPDGTVLDDPAIAVHNTTDEARFALTSNGTEWLVTLQGVHSGESDIRAVRVSGLGVVLNPGGTQLQASTNSLFNLKTVSAQGEYLFVWGNGNTPRGQRYAADLTPIGDWFPVNSLNIASNGTDYFLTWIGTDTNFDTVVFGQRLSIDGFPGPAVTLAGAGGGLAAMGPAQTGWDGSDWWVSWLETTRGVVFSRMTPGDVALEPGGLPVDPAAPTRPAEEHAIAGMPGGGAQFVWSDDRAGGASSRDIYSANVDFAGIPGPSEPISTSTRSQLFLDFAEGADSLGNDQLLAVYLSEHSGVRKIVGQRLDGAGNALDAEPFEIASGTTLGISSPHVGFDGTRYMVVWAEGGQTFARRVGTDGSLIDAAPLPIMEGVSPDVAGQNGSFLVVNTQPTISIHFFHPFSMRVDGATGATLDAAPVILGQYFARRPRVIALDGRWLTTWQRNFSHDDVNSNAQAAFINPDGTSPGEFTYAFTGATPDVASAGDRVLFVWRTNADNSGNNDIQGRVMMADGSFLTPAVPIATQLFSIREFDPDVAWNGTEFVVAWTDERHEVIYFDDRSEVFAARVMPDGSLLDPDGFSIGDLSVQEIHPSVASVGGRTIIAHSSFRDDPANQSYRIGYQMFGDSPLGNRWPVATASATPTQGDDPLAVNFSTAGSTDPDGSIASYSWDFGDGATGTGASPSHTYAVPGEYMAEVTVTDNQGAETRNNVRVVVTPVNQPPVAVVAADRTSGRAPMNVIYQAAGSYDPDDGIQQISWDFGDGGTYFGGTAFHTYTTGGTFVTTMTVTDNRGASAQDTVTITVGTPNLPPVAIADATPFSGTSPLSVSLSSAGSFDGDGSITSYHWNFGDGTSTTDPNPTHVYDRGGLFGAILTVTDNEGGSGSATVVIDVEQGDRVSVASADHQTEVGTITQGSYLDTHSVNGLYEELTEEATKGKQSKQRSQGSHTWRMTVAQGVSFKFFVDAYHTPNSEGDDFAFEYSRDGVNFVPMLVVTNLAPGGPLISYNFTENVSGTLYVRARDTDRSQGNSALDTLFVDQMFVTSSTSSGGDTTPPAAPTLLAATPGDGSVSLNWADNVEPDLAGYSVYRATTAGGPYVPLTATLISPSAYVDSTVTNGSTYYYVVTATDNSSNESPFSAEDSATPQSTGAATSVHVSAISLSTVNAGRGKKQGQATVTVLDNLGSPIVGVTVTGIFSGDLSETGSATTNASGVAVLTSVGSAKPLSFTFCVDSVTGPLTYNSGADVVGCQIF